MFDSTFAVRDGVVQVIKELIPIFGQKWVENKVIKEICDNKNHNHYSKRLTVILFLKNLANQLSNEFIASNVLPVISELSSDNVPNIRLNVVKAIKEIASSVKDSQARDALKMSLRVLNKDEDSDVRFFAEQVVRTFG